MEHIVFDQNLTKADRLLLSELASDIGAHAATKSAPGAKSGASRTNGDARHGQGQADAAVDAMKRLNDPKDSGFEPTVFNAMDLSQIQMPKSLNAWVLQPYIRFARSLVRVETDVVMITHLLLYFATSVPSAVILFRSFTWVHGILHFIMQVSYMGTYTLMMHQHIHMRGILKPRFALFDMLFPYITDPLMGHSWNTYFYHHVKHHHVEGNGPDDLSTTLNYQRDNIFHLLHYIGRFFFFIWLDLPLYFVRKGRYSMGAKAFGWELATYVAFYFFFSLHFKAAFFVFGLPHFLLRLGLMIGNWGQHAFVDNEDPDSDYRSSITLIDTQSNRHCYNDGYHTSHHLNPLRHWREHPVSFLQSKETYAEEEALVFHNIDYIFITIRLMMHDYETLAKCLVPMGSQIAMSLDERAAYLKSRTRKFTKEEISEKFKKSK